ncbi:hypothetical protein SKAU_G00067850 [Synaphobranchus kaupii]|uniref:DUF4371 domain-containing protein n=1 Tax=Synaphobranchus kaupii TaxID=118154 RepID=A0A9Q1G7R5_SYNKA|nr:hypothetical protein SKAU_G00067850 [Synaphobranchus kaupii]
MLVSETESPFVKEAGFSNWRKALEKIREHEKSRIHVNANQRLAALRSTPINVLLSDAIAKNQQTAREVLEILFSSVRFLGRQGLPLRGNENRDRVLWQLMVERVRSDRDHFDWMNRRDNWMSPNIQNEILELFAHEIQRQVATKASQSLFLGLTADGMTDITGKEQFSCNIQFADANLQVHNVFLGFYNAPDTTAEMLFLCVKDVLIRLNLSMERLQGYCFDGASNMSGRFKGVQARLKEVCPDSCAPRGGKRGAPGRGHAELCARGDSYDQRVGEKKGPLPIPLWLWRGVARSLQGSRTALGSMESAKLLCHRLSALRQDFTVADLVGKTKEYAARYNLRSPQPPRVNKTPAHYRHTDELEMQGLDEESDVRVYPWSTWKRELYEALDLVRLEVERRFDQEGIRLAARREQAVIEAAQGNVVVVEEGCQDFTHFHTQ